MERASGDVKHKTASPVALETSVRQDKSASGRVIDTFPGDRYDNPTNVR